MPPSHHRLAPKVLTNQLYVWDPGAAHRRKSAKIKIANSLTQKALDLIGEFPAPAPLAEQAAESYNPFTQFSSWILHS
jgi:hypothetical protein